MTRYDFLEARRVFLILDPRNLGIYTCMYIRVSEIENPGTYRSTLYYVILASGYAEADAIRNIGSAS